MTRSQRTLRQFTLENRRKRQLCRNPTALSRHLTFALAVLCLKNKTSATENSCLVVHKLCRTSNPCGKRRKRRKKYLTGKFLRASLNVPVELGLSQQIPCFKIFLIPGMIALRTQRDRPLPPSLFRWNDVPGIFTNQISRDKVERPPADTAYGCCTPNRYNPLHSLY